MFCLSTFCSVCLEGGKELQGLNSMDIDDIPILNKLIFVCFGHEPIDINTLRFICKSCVEILRSSYQFKRMSLLNNDILRGYISQLKYFTGTKGLYGNTLVSLTRTEDEFLDNNFDMNENDSAAELAENSTPTIPGKPQKFQCKVCGQIFKKSISRLIHFNKYHGKYSNTPQYLILKGANGYNCQYCSRLVRSKSHLFQHLTTHKEVNYVTCDYCPMVCNMKQGYEAHVCGDHGVEINRFCSICNKVVPDYMKHMSGHITPRIKCPYCTKVFFTERTCKYHVNVDHWKYQCSLCNKMCFSETSVSEHINSHNATIDIMKPIPDPGNQEDIIDFNALLHDHSIGFMNSADNKSADKKPADKKPAYKKPGPKSKTMNLTKTTPTPPPKKKEAMKGYRNKPGPKSKKLAVAPIIKKPEIINPRKKIKLMGPKSRRAKITATKHIAELVKHEKPVKESDSNSVPKVFQTKMDQYIHESNLSWTKKKVHTSKPTKRDTQVKCTQCLITFASSKSLITHKCFSSNAYQCPKCKVVYMTGKSFKKHTGRCLRKKPAETPAEDNGRKEAAQNISTNVAQPDNSLDTTGVVVKQEPFMADPIKEEIENDSDTPVMSLNPFSQFASCETEENSNGVVVLDDNYNSNAENPLADTEPEIAQIPVVETIRVETPMEVDCEIVPNDKNDDDVVFVIPPQNKDDNIIDLSGEQVPEINIKTEFPNCDAPDSTVPEVVESSNSPSSTVDQSIEPLNQNKEPENILNSTIQTNFSLVVQTNAINNIAAASSSTQSENQPNEIANYTNLSCNLCEAKFPTSGLLTSHLLVHSYQTSMKCITCKKTFLTQYDLDRHIMLTYRTGCGEARRF